MNSRPQTRSTLTAFTLVELLTVITIIAILMGLLFPAITTAKDQARKAQAKAAVMQIATAVKQYYSEYAKYPLGTATPTGTPADVLFGGAATPPNSNQIVFDILRNTNSTGTAGTPNPYNPRGIVFYEDKSAADPNAPKAGFATQDASSGGITVKKGALVDPWGVEYGIAIDGDYNNQIINLPYNDFSGTTTGPLVGVAVFSLGKDKGVGTAPSGGTGDGMYRKSATSAPSDDIVSWQ